MTNSTQVAVIGDNTIDRYLDGPEYIGGNALNVAVQLRLLGAGVTYFGAVGDDDEGREIADALRRHDVATEGLVTADGATAVTEIQVTSDGDRVFVREDFGVTAHYRPSDAELARIGEHGWVHIGMLPRAAEFVMRLRALAPAVRISQDCAVSSGFGGLDVAFCSTGEDESAALSAVREALSGGATLAVVTRGAEGALASDGQADWRCEAAPVEVVDTTGAGDSFIAGFIAARLDGAPVLGALSAGARIAARTCSHLGGFPQ